MTQAVASIATMIDTDQLRALQMGADAVYVDPALMEYAVTLAGATRDPASVGQIDLARYVTYGASPRASINLILAARALAFVRGRNYALPDDVRDLAPDVLRHRLVLSYESLADGVTPDDILARLLTAIPVPDVPLTERGVAAGDVTNTSRRT